MDSGGYFSYADYLKWNLEENIELIRGRIFKMSPAPAPLHQTISHELSLSIGNFLRKKNCRLFAAPFDVRLPDKKKMSVEDADIFTVVQPDLCVICDLEKLDDKGCIGAPDWVLEILSPGNSKKEMRDKFEIYEEAGVREYWIVDSSSRSVLVYLLQEGKFRGLRPFTDDESIPVHIFDDFSVNMREIYAEVDRVIALSKGNK